MQGKAIREALYVIDSSTRPASVDLLLEVKLDDNTDALFDKSKETVDLRKLLAGKLNFAILVLYERRISPTYSTRSWVCKTSGLEVCVSEVFE